MAGMTKYERILGITPKTTLPGVSASSASTNGCFNGTAGGNLEEFIESLQYVDESPDANSGGEGDNNTQGSQVSISQLSTVASSGYQRYNPLQPF